MTTRMRRSNLFYLSVILVLVGVLIPGRVPSNGVKTNSCGSLDMEKLVTFREISILRMWSAWDELANYKILV